MEIAARDFTVISSRIGLARHYRERHASTTVTALNLNTATGVLMLVGEYVRLDVQAIMIVDSTNTATSIHSSTVAYLTLATMMAIVWEFRPANTICAAENTYMIESTVINK